VGITDITTRKFYRYFLTQNMPLHIVDGSIDWPAQMKWTDEYLGQMFGSKLLKVHEIESYEKDDHFNNQHPEMSFVKFSFDINKAHYTNTPLTMREFIKRRAKDKVILERVKEGSGSDEREIVREK
jgi:hypothetical protein